MLLKLNKRFVPMLARNNLFRFYSSSTNLSSKLKEELDFEKSEAPETKRFKQENVWSVEDKLGFKEVVFTRNFNNEEIKVYASTDSIEGFDIDEDIEEEAEQDEGAEPQLTLQMVISKPGANNVLELTCSSVAQGNFQVENVSCFPSAAGLDVTAEGDWKRGSMYGSPVFDQLDEELVLSFDNFIEERGLTSDFAKSIQEYLIQKEQGEYINWLEDVKSFVEKQ